MRRLILLGAAILLLGAGSAEAAEVRFVHAVPGAGAASLFVAGQDAGEAAFGDATGYTRAESGEVELTLRAPGQEEELATATASLGDGRSTVVAMPEGEGVQLRVYEDADAAGGSASVRVIHAVPELEMAEVHLDERTLADLDFGSATEYEDVEPGTYSVSLMRPGGEGGALMEDPQLNLAAGTATTAVALGSRGEPTRFVALEDHAAAPAAGPDTGLGGMSEDGSPWPAAILAALLAGAAGGLGWFLLVARRRS